MDRITMKRNVAEQHTFPSRHDPESFLGRQSYRRNPFQDLDIKCPSILNEVTERSPCPKCFKSRKFFCYTCYVPVSDLENKIPYVKLPLKIDIIKHKNEIDGKSTSTHAALIAPDDVTIHQYPDIPDYAKEEGVVLIFPSTTSVSITSIFGGNEQLNLKDNFGLPKGCHMGTLLRVHLKDIVESNSNVINPTDDEHSVESLMGGIYTVENLPIKRAVFIDSTWNQCRGIYKDERISSLKSIVLQNRASQFWRHQKGSPRWYLATIEAIHQFLLEVHINAWGLNQNYYKNLVSLEICVDFIPEAKIFHGTGGCDEGNELPISPIGPYNGQYDNLLFFFMYMYDLIHYYYDHDALKSYKRPFN